MRYFSGFVIIIKGGLLFKREFYANRVWVVFCTYKFDLLRKITV